MESADNKKPEPQRDSGFVFQTRQTEACRTLALEAAACAFESVPGLLRRPGQHAHRVVAVAENVVAGRKTMLRAIYLHLVELLDVKLVIAHHAPVVRRGIHRETRRQRTVRANDQRSFVPRDTARVEPCHASTTSCLPCAGWD